MVKAVRMRKKTGRPPGDPDDVRSERTAMRMHPNLLRELNVAAREAGKNRSLFTESILIGWINARLMARGERPLDAIGKYVSDEEMERLNAMSDAASAAQYAQRTMDYGGPPLLAPSPVHGGMPRWSPPPPPVPPHRKPTKK
jgi:hypothetical protein